MTKTNIEKIMEDMKTAQELMDIASEKMKGMDPMMQLAFIATTFDHVCEVNHLNKSETLNDLLGIINQVNTELGDMY